MKFGNFEFVGLDIETTGSDINSNHGLIQIGVDFGAGARFVSDVKPHVGAAIDWEEAMTVNKFTIERLEAAPDRLAVDLQLHTWLAKQGAEKRRLIPVGWNVAGFDMPFVRRYLPSAATMFSYRSVDLNAICFTMSGSKHPFEEWKRQAKKIAADAIAAEDDRFEPAWHDALYDARAALHSWLALRMGILAKFAEEE